MNWLTTLLLATVGAVLGFTVAANWPDFRIVRNDSCIVQADHTDAVWIEGSSFTMGSAEYYPKETPVDATVGGFWGASHIGFRTVSRNP